MGSAGERWGALGSAAATAAVRRALAPNLRGARIPRNNSHFEPLNHPLTRSRDCGTTLSPTGLVFTHKFGCWIPYVVPSQKKLSKPR
jgi:hypothetical protein